MKKWTKKQKEEFRRRFVIVSAVTLIFILVLTGGLSVYQNIMKSSSPPVPTAEPAKYKVPKPEMQEALLTKNPNSRPGILLEQVRGVVIHYTANPGTDAMANRNYFEGRKNMEESVQNKVSSHFVIGLDGTIIQCIPLEEIAYASNDRNRDTISIECCHPGKSGKFTKETKDSLISLTAWLCGQYFLQKKDIIRHYDVTGKSCPKYYVKHPRKWEALQETVIEEMKKYKVN
ncbi:MAG: N-acetylmuramoyl-L-alanine amidase [Lachnospiraceae bacterium]|nr:N-acetylmuramoyl-L-alanine amidase [Lachnospiraceae bacterium]